MNIETKIYRKRFIPNETLLLKDDIILAANDDLVVTKWNSIKPRSDISYGYSAYFLNKGFKLSKVFNKDDSLVYWYCDIITHDYEKETNALTVTDLLIDVLVYADGSMRILDLNELADSLEQSLIDLPLAVVCLRHANTLFTLLASGEFTSFQATLNAYIAS